MKKAKNGEGLRSMHAQLLSGYHGQGVACEEKQQLFIFNIVLNFPK